MMKLYEVRTLRIRDPEQDTREWIGDFLRDHYPGWEVLSMEKGKGYWEIKIQFYTYGSGEAIYTKKEEIEGE